MQARKQGSRPQYLARYFALRTWIYGLHPPGSAGKTQRGGGGLPLWSRAPVALVTADTSASRARWLCRIAGTAAVARWPCHSGRWQPLGADVLLLSLGLPGSSWEIDVGRLQALRLAWGAQLRTPVSALRCCSVP